MHRYLRRINQELKRPDPVQSTAEPLSGLNSAERSVSHHSGLVWMIVFMLAATGCGGNSPPPGTKAAGEGRTNSPPGAEPGAAENPASTAGTPASTTVAAAKPRAKPTPEQISKWAVVSHQPLQLLACYDGFGDGIVQSLAVTPDGKQFALGGVRLTLWNTAESKPTIDLIENLKEDELERPIRSVALSPNGTLLAAGDQKGVLRIWTLKDQAKAQEIKAHEGRLVEMVFSPDSQKLATTSYSGEVIVWQVTDGQKLTSFKAGDSELARLLFLTDTLLACAGPEASIWNIETGNKESTLTKGHVSNGALGLSPDRRWLAFNDDNSKLQLWDVQKAAPAAAKLNGTAGDWIEYSPDGKWLATLSSDSINIRDAASGSILQVIDADGDRTVSFKWLRESQALLVASEQGRVRIWGTPEGAKVMGIEPLTPPTLKPLVAGAKKSLSSAQLLKVIDIRSFPRLPGAVPMMSEVSAAYYTAPKTTADEAEMFYHHYLSQAGWTELPASPMRPGMGFQKEGCELGVSFTPSSEPGRAADLQVSINFAGNYDVRWLPQVSPTDSKSAYSSFSNLSYRTKASMTEVEVSMLKQFHQAGWTGYTRLNSAYTEQPDSRTISMLQGGSVLTAAIGYPADSPDECFVQTSLNVSTKSLPIPADSGWIEFDSSTDLQTVINTKLNLKEATEFYDTEMANEGWLAREAGRRIEEKQIWLPYIRGQQDIGLLLRPLPDGKTQIIVGKAAVTSWQLQKPKKADSEKEQLGIEAADLQLPKGATAVKFDVDDKQILFEITGLTPPKLAEQYAKQMEALEWKRSKSGVVSDEYTMATFEKEKSEIEMRIRADGKKTTVMIGGDGLLWTKPLLAAPVRISYETWLHRGKKPATLELLEEFSAEMLKIPAGRGKGK